MKYNIKLNNGNEALGVNEKTITAVEVVENVDAKFWLITCICTTDSYQKGWPRRC